MGHWMCSKCDKNTITYAVKVTGEPIHNCHTCNMRMGNCHLFWCDRRGDQIVPTVAMNRYLAEERATIKKRKETSAEVKARKAGQDTEAEDSEVEDASDSDTESLVIGGIAGRARELAAGNRQLKAQLAAANSSAGEGTGDVDVEMGEVTVLKEKQELTASMVRS